MSTRDIYAGPSNDAAGLLVPGNIIDLYNRPQTAVHTGVDRTFKKDTRSTTFSKSFNIDGKETLLPTVVGGKILNDEEAIERFNRTGQHLGMFDTPENADKFAGALHESQQAMGKRYGATSALGNKAIRVKLRSGHAVEFPPGTAPEDVHRGARNASLALQIPPDAVLRARTASDDLRLMSEHAGRVVAKLLGIDYDAMDQLNQRGIKLAMLPFGPPSEAGQKLLKTQIKMGDTVDGPTAPIMAQVVDPEKYMYKKGLGFNSLVVDYNGHLIDLGGALHDDAMGALEPELYGTMRKIDPDFAYKGAMPAALEKNKFVRVNYSPGNIGLEMYHAPSPHQIETLYQLFDTATKMKPSTLGSYDLFNGAKNVFKNGVTPADTIDKLFDFYYSK